MMTTEEIHNFHTGDEERQRFSFLWLSHQFKWKLLPRPGRRLRLRRAAIEELGKITKSKAVSLETKVSKIIHTLVFPITVPGCESWAVETADRNIYSFEIWNSRGALQIHGTARKTDTWVLV